MPPLLRTRVLSLVAIGVLAAGGLVADRNASAVSYAPPRYPFQGAGLFLDRDTAAARWQAENGAGWLDPITRHPQARWLNGPQDLDDLPAVAERAARQGALLVLVVYHVPDRDCAGPGVGAPSADAYDRFVDAVIHRLGDNRAVIVMEPDAVAAECFQPHRAALLARNVRRLATAGHYVYLDAGHPRWRSTREMARRLLASGIADAEGFSVNVANRQTTDESYEWGLELSRRVGGRDFVIDTSRNGLGPPPDEPGDWCNPRYQGLGPAPTTATDRPKLAALLWIKPPGESDGACGSEIDHGFSPYQARVLIRNARPR